MFEESLLNIRTQSRWPTVASFALQAAIAATIIIVPILHPEVVPLHAKLTEITAPPVKAPPTPPPPQRVRVENNNSIAPATATVEVATALAPRLIPSTHPTLTDDGPPPIGSITGMGNNTHPGLDLGTSTSSNTGPNIAVIPTAKAGPLNISHGVSMGMLLAPITPIYPPIARAAHQEGTVTIHAIISKTGKVESANAISGPVMLQGAALDAIRVARYRPYLLNGLPTEVDTTFIVVFHLSS
jgi:protein TonB